MANLILPHSCSEREAPPEQPAWRDYRCPRCGWSDTFRAGGEALVVPVHCHRAMIPGRVRAGPDRAPFEIDVTQDRNEPWRIGQWAGKRGVIVGDHPEWSDLHQVWRRGPGRLHGSEFVGMVGCLPEAWTPVIEGEAHAWQYDLGPFGFPDDVRSGRGRTLQEAAAAAALALDR